MPNNIQQRNTRIAKNTFFLYVRMVFVLGVALYTSRVLLEVMGFEDYGIYNVVGGVVTMLGFLNGAMISSTQRFFSYAIGQNDYHQLSLNYSTILIIQIFLSLLILVIAETLGVWFVKNYLVYPHERYTAVLWIFHFAALTFVVTMLQVPFSALIITHEKMNAYAAISISDILLKLLVVIILPLFNFDKVILYAMLLFLVSLITLLVYVWYTRLNFRRVKYLKQKNRALFKTLLSYMGWNLWGNAAAVIMNHGVNILINIFFGPAVNAARAISYQVQGATTQLYSNFKMAMDPQIVKSYAGNELVYMHKLIYRGAKLCLFLVLCLALPMFLETDFLLNIWLKSVPEHTVVFVKLILVYILIESLSGTLMTAIQATGKIAFYQSVVGGLLIANLPISYTALRLGATPETTIIIAILISILAFFVRVLIAADKIKIKKMEFIYEVFVKSMLVAIISYFCCAWTTFMLPASLGRAVLTTAFSVLSVSIIMLYVGFDKTERTFVIHKTKEFILTKRS